MRAEDQARRDREKEHEGVVEQELNLLQSREQGTAEPMPKTMRMMRCL